MNEQAYIDLYKQQVENIKKHAPEALNVERECFFEQFQQLGFPHRKTPNYRHTDFTQALSIDYGLNINRLNILNNPNNAFRCDVPGIQSYLFYVMNDAFYGAGNKNEALPQGVIICSLQDAAEHHPALVNKYLHRQTKKQKDGFIAFNGAFAQDGFFMYVPKNVVLERPVQLVNMMNAQVDFMANSHNLIVIEEGAQAKLVVCDHVMDNVNFFSNRVTEVFVGERAVYDHYKIEASSKKMNNVCSLLIDQQAGSTVLGNIITLHNGQTRNSIQIDMQGEHCETKLCGMVAGDGRQLIDNTTVINHNFPNCVSHELFKYILDEDSLGVFNGILRVLPDAQKTAAFQTNKNILLSSTAKIRTQPQLEIYADDVKCTHGSTTGQLDENALFYMQQRGISEREAKLMLMYAFVSDVIDNIKLETLRDKVRFLVEQRLKGDIGGCAGCDICK